MVFWDLKASLRVSGLLYLAIMAVQYFMLKSTIEFTTSTDLGEFPPAGPIFLTVVVTVVASLWIAVAWHRYVLEDEQSGGILPAFHGGRLLKYLGTSILLGLVLVIPIFALMLVAGFILVPLSGAGSTAMSLIPAIALVPAAYAINRLSPILPAAAVGKKLSLKQAWAATANISSAIWGLTFLGMVIYAISSMVGSAVLPETLTSMMLQSLVFGWISTMVGVSVLTTIYGVAIEGRELP
jgi:hypothetical protein